MKRPVLRGRLAAAALLTVATAITWLPTSAAAQTPAQRPGPVVVEQSVTFTVRNVNRTEIDCAADGRTYQVRGHIVGPAGAIDDADAVTLFLHGLSYGEFFTNFDLVPGYNFADKQARDGHVTVTIDRLGYDSSDRPATLLTCIGAQADIADQIVRQLRSGDYDTGNGARSSRSFDQVVLAGHSVGGLIAQTVAHTFGDIDGLMVLSYSDVAFSPSAQLAAARASLECVAGRPGPPGRGYVFFGATPLDFVKAHFFVSNASPVVTAATAAIRNQDPCGDVLSYVGAVTNDLAHVDEIDVPTLVLIGGEDAIYPVPASTQAALLTGSDDVTAVTLPATGHAVTLHYTADAFQNILSTWLDQHGFPGSR